MCWVREAKCTSSWSISKATWDNHIINRMKTSLGRLLLKKPGESCRVLSQSVSKQVGCCGLRTARSLSAFLHITWTAPEGQTEESWQMNCTGRAGLHDSPLIECHGHLFSGLYRYLWMNRMHLVFTFLPPATWRSMIQFIDSQMLLQIRITLRGLRAPIPK